MLVDADISLFRLSRSRLRRRNKGHLLLSGSLDKEEATKEDDEDRKEMHRACSTE